MSLYRIYQPYAQQEQLKASYLQIKEKPIVVSGILGVSGSSGHEPGSKDLQNKQGIGGGVSVDSPMLKLDREIESVNVSFLVKYFHLPLCCHSSIFYEG